MTDPLQVTPDQMRATAMRLAEVSSELRQVLSSIRAMQAGFGAVWGDDKAGREFGEKYLKQVDWVDGSLDVKAELLEFYAEGLHTAVNDFEQQDQG
jgi:uncharacterized protein YukE